MFLVVQHHQQRAGAGHFTQQFQQHIGVVVREIGRGLIHHQKRWLGHGFAQDGHSPLQQGRQLQRGLVEQGCQFGHAHALDQFSAPGPHLGGRAAQPFTHWVGQGMKNGGCHELGVLLHQAGTVALTQRLSFVLHAAPFGEARMAGIPPRHGMQQRGLARARRPQQRSDAAARQSQVNVGENHLGAKSCAKARCPEAVRAAVHVSYGRYCACPRPKSADRKQVSLH